MKSQCTGESLVPRPFTKAKFYEVIDPDFEVDWFCSVFGVSKPTLNRTHGRRGFSGSYVPGTKRLNYTEPVIGGILHELAHHICHEQGQNGRKDMHNQVFADILQEMIDLCG